MSSGISASSRRFVPSLREKEEDGAGGGGGGVFGATWMTDMDGWRLNGLVLCFSLFFCGCRVSIFGDFLKPGESCDFSGEISMTDSSSSFLTALKIND
jgi:hypothetical protein